MTTSVGVVLPPDLRGAVTNATVQPNRWIGQLESTWANGNQTVGTATLIDDRYLITCAHNLFDRTTQKHCTGAVFRPGLTRNGAGTLQVPYGQLQVDRWSVPQEYRDAGGPPPPPGGVALADVTKYLFDYGVARLAQDAPAALVPPLFQNTWPGKATVTASTFTVTGYSGDLDATAGTQFTRTGGVGLDPQEELLTYRMSTYHGDSGAPIYAHLGGKPWWSIVGVHVSGVVDTPVGAGNGFNFGPAFTPQVLQSIQGLIASI